MNTYLFLEPSSSSCSRGKLPSAELSKDSIESEASETLFKNTSTGSTPGPMSSSLAEEILWPQIWNNTQVQQFSEKYSWLSARNGKLGCTICVEAKTLHLMKENARLSSEWVNFRVEAAGSNRENQLSSLRSKLKRHEESISHKAAEEIQKKKEDKSIECKIEKLSEKAITQCSKLMRTAYSIAKNNRSYTEYEEIVALQELNGVDLGISLHSRQTCTRMIDVIAEEMRRRLVRWMMENQSKFSLLIDESTPLSNKSTLILYFALVFDDYEPTYVFFNLLELESQDAECIVKAIWTCFRDAGFSDTFIKNNMVTLLTDGASVMVGSKSGVWTRMKADIPHLLTFHCMAHRLELSVHDVKKDVTGVNRFTSFMDKLYSFYSASPKNTRAIQDISSELHTQFQKIGRVLGVRWASSSLRTVKAVWTSYKALYTHFSRGAETCTKNAERAVFLGMKKKLETAEFLKDLGFLYDVLSELSILSKVLQSRKITIMRANAEISRSIRMLLSFKENPGLKTNEVTTAIREGEFCDIEIRNTGKENINQNQFLQSLVDSMSRRLLNNSETIYQDLDVVQTQIFNVEPMSDATNVGEKEVKNIAQRFNLDEEQCIVDFRLKNLKSEFMKLIQVVVCSTAECERGFSCMNNIITDLRSVLLIPHVSNLMFISINGPALEKFQPESYVKLWLKEHRKATDKLRGTSVRPRTEQFDKKNNEFFEILFG